MNFINKLSIILGFKPINESILFQDGEYTIEDDQLEIQDPDGLPDEDKFGNTKTYYLKKNGEQITKITISESGTTGLWLTDVNVVQSLAHQETIAKLPIVKKFMATQEPMTICYYIIDYNIGKFPEGEPKLLTNPYYASTYAIYVLKKRWPEAEPNIKTNPEIWHDYTSRFQ